MATRHLHPATCIDTSSQAATSSLTCFHSSHIRADNLHYVKFQAWQWIPVPTYAIDDETAITVIDRTVEVISEGNWKLFNP